MIEQSIKQPKRSKCCNALIGFDGWVDSNDEICGGPFDASICIECGMAAPYEANPEPDDSADNNSGGPKAPGAVSLDTIDTGAPKAPWDAHGNAQLNCTPGPWIVSAVWPDKTLGHSFAPRVWISAWCKVRNGYSGTIRLADIPDVSSRDSEEMANARLMAAAPELYAALKDLLRLYEEGDTYEAEISARAAIAKAEGRTP